MFVMAHKQQCLLAVQRVRAGDIHGVNHIGLRQRRQIVKQMLDLIGGAEASGLLQTAGIDGVQPHFSALMGGIDKAFADPVGADDGKTNHR